MQKYLKILITALILANPAVALAHSGGGGGGGGGGGAVSMTVIAAAGSAS